MTFLTPFNLGQMIQGGSNARKITQIATTTDIETELTCRGLVDLEWIKTREKIERAVTLVML
jgi:hypothetical protein